VDPHRHFIRLFSLWFSILTLAVGSMSSLSAHAADLEKLETLFTETFVSNYQPRFCGENIKRFVAQAAARGIDLSGASIYKIVGGAWNLQTFAARGLRPGGAQPFEFHWILVADGKVFDYDYTDRAQVITLEEYIPSMFIPRSRYEMGNFDPVHELRERIVFTAFDALAYVKNGYATAGLPFRNAAASELVDLDKVISKAQCRAHFER
jgi:hypothetical protein